MKTHQRSIEEIRRKAQELFAKSQSLREAYESMQKKKEQHTTAHA